MNVRSGRDDGRSSERQWALRAGGTETSRISSPKTENEVIISSPPRWWKVSWGFVAHKTFLEPHSKAALQHSPKQLNSMVIYTLRCGLGSCTHIRLTVCYQLSGCSNHFDLKKKKKNGVNIVFSNQFRTFWASDDFDYTGRALWSHVIVVFFS